VLLKPLGLLNQFNDLPVPTPHKLTLRDVNALPVEIRISINCPVLPVSATDSGLDAYVETVSDPSPLPVAVKLPRTAVAVPVGELEDADVLEVAPDGADGAGGAELVEELGQLPPYP
jgi:hypothetical protein